MDSKHPAQTSTPPLLIAMRKTQKLDDSMDSLDISFSGDEAPPKKPAAASRPPTAGKGKPPPAPVRGPVQRQRSDVSEVVSFELSGSFADSGDIEIDHAPALTRSAATSGRPPLGKPPPVPQRGMAAAKSKPAASRAKVASDLSFSMSDISIDSGDLDMDALISSKPSKPAQPSSSKKPPTGKSKPSNHSLSFSISEGDIDFSGDLDIESKPKKAAPAAKAPLQRMAGKATPAAKPAASHSKPSDHSLSFSISDGEFDLSAEISDPKPRGKAPAAVATKPARNATLSDSLGDIEFSDMSVGSSNRQKPAAASAGNSKQKPAPATTAASGAARRNRGSASGSVATDDIQFSGDEDSSQSSRGLRREASVKRGSQPARAVTSGRQPPPKAPMPSQRQRVASRTPSRTPSVSGECSDDWVGCVPSLVCWPGSV